MVGRKSFPLLIALIYILGSGRASAQSRFARKIDTQKLEADLLHDEEPDDDAAYKMEVGEDGRFHATGESLTPKPEMMFVQLKKEYAVTEDEAAEVARKWTDLLWTNGLNVKPYPIGPGRLLFVVNTGMYDFHQFKDFCLDQQETETFEYKNRKYYPGGEIPDGSEAFDMAKIEKMLRGNDKPPKKRPRKKNKKRKKKKSKKKKASKSEPKTEL
ncbi:hypothetical protein AAMO2058_001330100 [Amorphochlora amoebiformis]